MAELMEQMILTIAMFTCQNEIALPAPENVAVDLCHIVMTFEFKNQNGEG